MTKTVKTPRPMTSGAMCSKLQPNEQLAERIAGRNVKYRGFVWNWDTSRDRWVVA